MKKTLPTRKGKADRVGRKKCSAADEEDQSELLTLEDMADLLDKLDRLLEELKEE